MRREEPLGWLSTPIRFIPVIAYFFITAPKSALPMAVTPFSIWPSTAAGHLSHPYPYSLGHCRQAKMVPCLPIKGLVSFESNTISSVCPGYFLVRLVVLFIINTESFIRVLVWSIRKPKSFVKTLFQTVRVLFLMKIGLHFMLQTLLFMIVFLPNPFDFGKNSTTKRC